MSVRYTTDAGQYLDRVGVFFRRRPVEHSVLLNAAASRIGEEVVGAESNLWLWVEDGDGEVAAAAQHTPSARCLPVHRSGRRDARARWHSVAAAPRAAGRDGPGDSAARVRDPVVTPGWPTGHARHSSGPVRRG
jgi:hypothetical protein